MKAENIFDKIWGAALVGLPALSIALGFIPGMARVFDADANAYINCNFFNAPGSSIMSLMGKVVLMVFAFTLIVSILYVRGQSINMLKGVLVMSIASCVVSALSLLPRQTLQPWPYVIVVILMGICSVVSAVHLAIENQKIDY